MDKAETNNYHKNLANYFNKKPLFLDEFTQKKPNARKLMEQPWQQTKAAIIEKDNEELWDNITNTLCNLDFIQAKAAAKLTYVLVNDFNEVLEVIPDNQQNIKEERARQARLDKYTQNLIACAKGEISIDELEIPESITPWTEEHINVEIERIKTNPNRTDLLKGFINFLGKEADNLQKYSFKINHFATQQAWNNYDCGPVGNAASEASKSTLKKLILKADYNRNTWNPVQSVLKIYKDANIFFGLLALTPDEKIALTASNINLKNLIWDENDKSNNWKEIVFKTSDIQEITIWDLKTGNSLSKLSSGYLKALAISSDGLYALTTGSNDKTCKLWDLKSGKMPITLIGHDENVNSIKITADGRYAISASDDKACILWDLIKGKPIKILKGHNDKVNDISITADGKYAVSASDDKTCILWDLMKGKSVKIQKNYESGVKIVKITPDGKYAITVSNSNSIVLWDLHFNKISKIVISEYNNLDYTPILRILGIDINDIDISPDGKKIIFSRGIELTLLNIENGKTLKIFKHTTPLGGVSITSDGKKAITTSSDKSCILWDLEKGVQPINKFEHKANVNISQLSPDNKHVVTSSVDKTCVYWDLQIREPLKKFTDLDSIITLFVITEDSKYAVSASEDNNCIYWDLQNFKPICFLKGHSGNINTIVITPNGRFAITASEDKKCILWDLKKGLGEILIGHTKSVNALSITPDGRRAISASSDNKCILWDLKTGRVIKEFLNELNQVTAFSISSDGRLIIYILANYCILFDFQNEELIKIFINCNFEKILITPNNKNLLTISNKNTISFWDLKTEKCINTFSFDNSEVDILAIFPDGKQAIVSLDDNSILWDINNWTVLKTLSDDFWVYKITISKDGKYALLSQHDNTCIYLDLFNWKSLFVLTGHTQIVEDIAITPDGKKAITASSDNSCIVWNLENGEKLESLIGHSECVNSVSISPDGKYVISASDDKTCIIWDLQNGKLIYTLLGHTAKVKKIFFTSDGLHAASVSDEESIFWDLQIGKLRKIIPIGNNYFHTEQVNDISISPDGKIAISASMDNKCIVWDIESGKPIKSLLSHKKGVRKVAFTPNGKHVVSISDDKTCIIWDLYSGIQTKVLRGYFDIVNNIAITKDGNFIITTSDDKTCIIWDLKTGEEIAIFIADIILDSLSIRNDNLVLYKNSRVLYKGISNELFFLKIPSFQKYSRVQIINIIKKWNHIFCKYIYISSCCPVCRIAHEPKQTALDYIYQISEINGLLPNESPILKLPKESWDHTDLLCVCPNCGEKLKYNPFIIDGFDDDYNIESINESDGKVKHENINKDELITQEEKLESPNSINQKKSLFEDVSNVNLTQESENISFNKNSITNQLNEINLISQNFINELNIEKVNRANKQIFETAEKAFNEEQWAEAYNLYLKLIQQEKFDVNYMRFNMAICKINLINYLDEETVNEIYVLIKLLQEKGESEKVSIITNKLNERIEILNKEEKLIEEKKIADDKKYTEILLEAEKFFNSEDWNNAFNMYLKLIQAEWFDANELGFKMAMCRINSLQKNDPDIIQNIEVLTKQLQEKGENEKVSIITDKLNHRIEILNKEEKLKKEKKNAEDKKKYTEILAEAEKFFKSEDWKNAFNLYLKLIQAKWFDANELRFKMAICRINSLEKYDADIIQNIHVLISMLEEKNETEKVNDIRNKLLEKLESLKPKKNSWWKKMF